MSTENTVQNAGERDVVAPRDSHQPIIAPGTAPKVPKPRDRDVVKPMDSHQPIAADAVAAEAPADKVGKAPAKGENLTTMDSHQPVGGVK
ncbi:hypothetical protein ACFU90_37590 [Streptomyces noursei]|uniref:Sigma-like protein n=1 Tax=Streptomyces noursei TaxID=1971 RepID=A0A401R2C6_STRNR|nr:hypothetical protein [Streptomyces noursei]AKA08743.1 hypothetical protein SAZ_19765 [Streptomyces noursei ZPM]EXU91677.1 hypothetical protein P354_38135 [Streptomyces noursei PD-1]UWS72821.1 hypothetical protein N1H47_17145 [Streptomyces noursei]GCB91795.1 hypothetical protein SALB_04537 [Streptomyces noursei]